MRALKPTPRVVFLAVRARFSKFSRLRRSGRITTGRFLIGTPRIRTFDGDTTTSLNIGHYCSISNSAVFMLGGNHPTDRRSTYPIRIMMGMPGQYTDGFPTTNGNIDVGHDVWIGDEAIVMSGVTIGNGAVIGARAVVTRDVEPYTIVVGNPARVIRRRFPEHVVEEVHALKWWDWSPEKIADHADFLNREVLDADVRRD